MAYCWALLAVTNVPEPSRERTANMFMGALFNFA